METSRIIFESLFGVDKIELVGHACKRMKQRSISLRDVIHALKHPDETIRSSAPGRTRVRWHKTKHVAVDVVYEMLSERVRVITVIRK